MSATLTAAVAFAAIVAGAWLGALLRRSLPAHHLSEETKSAVQIGVGLVATMAALVLGFLLAAAKSSYDTKAEEIQHSAARLILLDRNLRQYGPGADPVRAEMRTMARAWLEHTWVDASSRAVIEPSPAGGMLDLEKVQERIRALAPATPGQRMIQERALQLCGELAQTRWLLAQQIEGSIPTPFLVLLICWLALIFASLTLFAPSNGTVNAVLLACALSVASAIFLIIEMDRPFGGLVRISDAPFRSAFAYLER